MRIRAILADDEPLARERLRGFLEAAGGVEVLAECRNGLEAVAAIEAHTPDLVFLDVQMPDLDGFGVVRRIAAERMPVVVFVTAFDRDEAGTFAAADFLLKPFDRQRFSEVLERALARCRRRRAGLYSAHPESPSP